MAKRSQKLTDEAGHAPPGKEHAPADRMGHAAWGIPVFLVALAGYWAVFYQGEVVSDVYGYQRLAYLLLPDQLVTDWCGGEFGRVQVLDRVGPVAAVAVISLVAGLLGWLILDVLRVRTRFDGLEVGVLAFGLGLSGVSLFTLVVGLAGGLRQPLWFMLFGLTLLIAVIWRHWRGGWLGHGPASRDDMPEPDRSESQAMSDVPQEEGPTRSVQQNAWWQPRWWWAAVPFAWIMLAGAVLPPLDFDVLEYHLQVPKEWFQQGKVTFLPHNVYGNMPLGSEMLATRAMSLMPGELAWWWGALAGKLAMASYTLLTTALLFAAGRRFYSARAGIIAALLYISTAWVAVVSLNGLNEGVIAYYLLASFYVGKLWWDRRQGPAPGGLLALTGLLAGAAVSCKYTSLLFVVVPLLVLVILGSRAYRVRATLVFLLAVSGACGLWFGKNWVLTGNPTYPLLVNVFGGETRTPEKDAQWRRAHQVPLDAQGRRYSFPQAWKAMGDLLGGSCWQNPLFVPFAVLLLLRWKRNRDIAYWGALLTFVLVAWWVATHRLERFWIPAIPVMALLAGVGATWSSTLQWRRTVAGVLGVGLVANFMFMVAPRPNIGDNRFFVSLEQLRDDPQMTMASGAYRPIAFAYLRAHVPQNSQTLVVGDAAVFDLQVPTLYNTCFDDCLFETLLRDRSEQQRRERLKTDQISHVYIDWAELRRYRQPGNYGYSPYVTPALVHDELVTQQKLLKKLDVPGLEPELGEIFEVTGH